MGGGAGHDHDHDDDAVVVFRGVDALLGHVAGHHRSETMREVILDRTCCINDHVADDDDDEDFNLNLFPPAVYQDESCAPLVLLDSALHEHLSV